MRGWQPLGILKKGEHPRKGERLEQPDSQIELTVRASPRMAYQVYDEFPPVILGKKRRENRSF